MSTALIVHLYYIYVSTNCHPADYIMLTIAVVVVPVNVETNVLTALPSQYLYWDKQVWAFGLFCGLSPIAFLLPCLSSGSTILYVNLDDTRNKKGQNDVYVGDYDLCKQETFVSTVCTAHPPPSSPLSVKPYHISDMRRGYKGYLAQKWTQTKMYSQTCVCVCRYNIQM